MKHPARRADQILADCVSVAGLLGRIKASREAARIIAPICAEIAPDFDPFRPGSCDLRERELRIWLRSSAQSTKLRQATPRLLTALQRHGLEVNEIKVGVQPRKVRESARNDAPNSAALPQDEALGARATQSTYTSGLAFARKLALTLQDSALRRAAQALGRAMDAKLARMRELNQPFDKQDRKERDADAQPQEKKTAGPTQIARLPADEVGQNAKRDDGAEDKQ
ncbi:MAG TPA: hypothetical protein VED47_13235 [Burkholderiaceae bacterium]|nr:hypothetical protein [Burkholderiaceae bacterium]